MRLYIIRHAEPAYPEDALTPRGREEARALARRLAGAGISALYSSPLRRALETARYTAELADLEVQVEPWARELETWWIPGGTAGELPAWQLDGPLLRACPGALDRQSWHTHPPLDRPVLGQGFAALCGASDTFLARQGYVREGRRYRVEASGFPRVALVCHGGFGLTWLAHLLEIPVPLIWAGFSLAPSSVTTIAFEPGPEGWAAPRCLGLGDLSHLVGESR